MKQIRRSRIRSKIAHIFNHIFAQVKNIHFIKHIQLLPDIGFLIQHPCSLSNIIELLIESVSMDYIPC